MRTPRHCPPTAPLKASTLPHQALEGEFRRRIHAGGLQEPGRGSSDTSMSPCPAPSTHMALNLLPGCTCLREHGTRGGRRHCHLFDAATLHMPAPPTRGCSHPQHLADRPSRGLANPAAQLRFPPPQEASPEGTGPASSRHVLADSSSLGGPGTPEATQPRRGWGMPGARGEGPHWPWPRQWVPGTHPITADREVGTVDARPAS